MNMIQKCGGAAGVNLTLQQKSFTEMELEVHPNHMNIMTRRS